MDTRILTSIKPTDYKAFIHHQIKIKNLVSKHCINNELKKVARGQKETIQKK